MSLSDFIFTDRARPVVEIGTGDEHGIGSTSTWDFAHWDDPADAHWAGTEPAWHDVSCDTFRYECGYGRAATIDRFLPGTATVLVDNANGWADPSHAVIPGQLTLRPGRQIRMGIVHATLGTLWLWRGYIDGIVPVYDPVQADTVEIHCIDALGEVNRAKSKPLTPAPAERADTRINRILDNALWSPGPRKIDASTEPLIPSDLGGQTADLLGQAADSVGGVVFGDQRGDIRFRARDWQAYNPNDPPDGSIGNSQDFDGNDVVYNQPDGTHLNYVWTLLPQAPAGTPEQVIFFTNDTKDVCPVRWERPFERSDISTRAILGRDAATAVQVDDIGGITLYGIEPFERTNLLTQDDATLALLAERVLEVRNDSTAPRIRSVTLNAATSDESLDLQATLDVFKPSRYLCRLVYDRGTVFEEMHFATGVRHIVDAQSWETDVNLDLAEPYANVGARWDSARWDQDIWTVAVTRLLAEARRALHDREALDA